MKKQNSKFLFLFMVAKKGLVAFIFCAVESTNFDLLEIL